MLPLLRSGEKMKNTFVNTSLNYLVRNNACSDKQINIFRYTLESLYSFMTKTCVVLVMALIFRTFAITFWLIVLYSLLRGFAFGLHASKNIYCWCITLFVYSFVPLLIKSIQFPTYLFYISYLIGIVFIMLWAPADTPSRPLLNKKKRKANKIFSLTLSIVYITSAFLINNSNYYEIISFLLLLESLCICPITYKIFKVPYNNYQKFNNK